jgi:hypothetical protein
VGYERALAAGLSGDDVLPGGESLFKRALNSAGIQIGDIAISNAVIPR